jgi:hypothetical protein
MRDTSEVQQVARHAVLLQYAAAHDWWSEQEQVLVKRDRADEARTAHECAVLILRAYQAELSDPRPT